MNINVKLPDSLLKMATLGEELEVDLQVSCRVDEDGLTLKIHSPENSRVNAVKKELAAQGKRIKKRAIVAAHSNQNAVENQTIISYWDNNVATLEGNEYRNAPVDRKRRASVLAALEEAQRHFSFDEIIGEIGVYADHCRHGHHMSNGNNYAYAGMGRFIDALVKAKKSGSQPWWHQSKVEDVHPIYTGILADSYAQEFLHRDAFGFRTGDANHRLFAAAAGFAKQAAEDDKTELLSFEEAVKELLVCAKNYGMKTTRTLVDPSFWTVTFIQHLRERRLIPYNFE